MKKLSIHLTILCLLALLLVPFAGCKKDEGTEETPATTDTSMSSDTMTTEPVTTATDTMTSDMGTDMTTSEPMTSEATPPAGQ
jgi:uncharacterized protein YpuA (DUF1002 family)